MVLTLGGSDMDRGVVSALLGHHILEILGQISGRVSLEEVIEFHGMVSLGSQNCMSQNST